MDCDAWQTENRPDARGKAAQQSCTVPLTAEGISRALSGFAAGRRLNQHSETVLRLSLPAHKLSAIRFPGEALAEAAQ